MSVLRSRVIEAMAREVYEDQVQRMVEHAAPKLMLLPEWDALTEDDRSHRLRISAAYLDAALSVLAEHADEWGASIEAGDDFDEAIDKLLAALKEDQ